MNFRILFDILLILLGMYLIRLGFLIGFGPEDNDDTDDEEYDVW